MECVRGPEEAKKIVILIWVLTHCAFYVARQITWKFDGKLNNNSHQMWIKSKCKGVHHNPSIQSEWCMDVKKLLNRYISITSDFTRLTQKTFFVAQKISKKKVSLDDPVLSLVPEISAINDRYGSLLQTMLLCSWCFFLIPLVTHATVRLQLVQNLSCYFHWYHCIQYQWVINHVTLLGIFSYPLFLPLARYSLIPSLLI